VGSPRLAGPAELRGLRAAEEDSTLMRVTPKHRSSLRKATPHMADAIGGVAMDSPHTM
jgi:hypothetical protein